jgi:hypothetical protein
MSASEGRSLRSQRARIAALLLHSKYDSKELTKPARRAFLEGFSQKVDPDGVLPEEERERRARLARRAYFARLALLSVSARAKGKQGHG